MLTAEEKAEFTYLNCLAFDLAREKAKETDTKIPVWLCSSLEAKVSYRREAIVAINAAVKPFIPFDEESAEQYIRDAISSTILQRWMDAEIEYKRLRVEENNPNAFFC